MPQEGRRRLEDLISMRDREREIEFSRHSKTRSLLLVMFAIMVVVLIATLI